VASRGNITVDGFTGTRGSLTLSAPGSIVNTALLYAANNLALYANTIANQRGDIMAGNSLVMQKDTAGNASAQIVNTSGNIETQNGDMTIKTGSLLNTRDGLSVNSWTETSQLAENGGAGFFAHGLKIEHQMGEQAVWFTLIEQLAPGVTLTTVFDFYAHGRSKHV
jgi:filamentous hemagglutinin